MYNNYCGGRGSFQGRGGWPGGPPRGFSGPPAGFTGAWGPSGGFGGPRPLMGVGWSNNPVNAARGRGNFNRGYRRGNNGRGSFGNWQLHLTTKTSQDNFSSQSAIQMNGTGSQPRTLPDNSFKVNSEIVHKFDSIDSRSNKDIFPTKSCQQKTMSTGENDQRCEFNVKEEPEPKPGPSNAPSAVEKETTNVKVIQAQVVLDEYCSDLNLVIDTSNNCSATPMTEGGFGYMWAGVRASHGVSKGRAYYEVYVGDSLDISHLENEQFPNVLRCGWSVTDASLQLGEDKNSYGYGGTAKASRNGKFVDYGLKFSTGDVVGCYVDFEAEEYVNIAYTVNGRNCGTAFKVSRNSLQGRSLYPHILTKNQKFTVNFGQMPAPLCDILHGYQSISTTEGLEKGPQPPQTRQDSEVLMMVGLPGAGKTYWAEKYRKKHPLKQYNILGTNSLIDKMKVQGLKRYKNYNGRWEVLIEKCTQCFNKILKIAAQRRRNYILDQTNVFPTSRVGKLKDFSGMTCKAIVIVPSDEEFQRRCRLRMSEEGVDIPESAVVHMKANFVLPEYEEKLVFADVLYTELGPEEAQETIKQYNAEAASLGYEVSKNVSQFLSRNKKKRQDSGFVGVIGRQFVDDDDVKEEIKSGPRPTEVKKERDVPAAVLAMNAALEAARKKKGEATTNHLKRERDDQQCESAKFPRMSGDDGPNSFKSEFKPHPIPNSYNFGPQGDGNKMRRGLLGSGPAEVKNEWQRYEDSGPSQNMNRSGGGNPSNRNSFSGGWNGESTNSDPANQQSEGYDPLSFVRNAKQSGQRDTNNSRRARLNRGRNFNTLGNLRADSFNNQTSAPNAGFGGGWGNFNNAGGRGGFGNMSLSEQGFSHNNQRQFSGRGRGYQRGRGNNRNQNFHASNSAMMSGHLNGIGNEFSGFIQCTQTFPPSLRGGFQ